MLNRATLAAQGGAPAILTNAQGGRKFKAFVKYSTANLPEVLELTVRPIAGRQLVIRQEAAQTCYTSIDQVFTAVVSNFSPWPSSRS